MSVTVGRPKSTQAGKLKKVHCELCGHTCYETLANLRDFPRWECCGMPLTVDDPEAAAITPEGREREADAYAYGENRKALAVVQAERISRYPQLQCKCCHKPNSVKRSAEILSTYERYAGSYGGGEIMLTHSTGMEAEESTCEHCGGDKFQPMRKRGKTAKQERRADDLPF